MAELPKQRGFYDDVRGFQRKDIKVRSEAFAPTPAEQRRMQLLVGLGIFIFVGGAFSLSQCLAKQERESTTHQESLWKDVNGWAPPEAHAPKPVPGKKAKKKH